MYGDLSLNPEKEFEGISLLPAAAPKYSTTHLDDLSVKYDQALGDVSPGEVAIKNNILGGTQSRLQDLMYQKQSTQIALARIDIIQQIANASGTTPTPEVLNAVKGLSVEDMSSENLGTILEEAYSKQVINSQVEASPDEYDNSIIADPNGTNRLLDVSEWAAARNMTTANLLTDLQTKYDQVWPVEKGLAWLGDLVPFRAWAANNSHLQGEFVDAAGSGDRIQQMVSTLHTLGPAEYKVKLEALVKNMIDHREFALAFEFLNANLQYGSTDAGLANLFNAADVASVIPFGLIGKALKGGIKAVGVPARELEVMAKVAGREEVASRLVLSEALGEGRLPSTIPGGGAKNVERNFNGISRPQEMFVKNPMRASAAVINRLQTAALSRASKALELLGVNKIERAAPEVIQAAVKKTEEDMRSIFSDQNHHILDVRHIEADNYSNIHTVEIKLGQKDGTFFPSEAGAKLFAGKWVKLRTKDYTIEKEASGYSISIKRNVDESRVSNRDLEVETDSPAPDGLWNRIVKNVKGSLPNATVGRDVILDRSLRKDIAELQKNARLVATSSVEEANHIIKELTKPFGTLNANKAEFKEWNSFVKKNRDLVDPVRGKGITYETMAEFEDAWQSMYNRLPSEAQMDAFAAYKQIQDLDRTVRALDVYKQKAIIGIEKFDLNVFMGELGKGETFAAKHKALVEPLNFEGKEVQNLPRGHKQGFTVAIVDEKGVVQKKYSRFMDDTQWDNVTKLKEQGYKIVQPYEGSVKIGDNRYNFVMVKNVQRGRIQPDMSYGASTRTVNKYPWFIKQGRVSIESGNARYFGDTALANARDAEEANFIAAKLEEVRKLMKGKRDQIKQIMGNGPQFASRDVLRQAKKIFDENLPMWKFEDYLRHVREGKISLDVPVMPVRQGQRLTDVGFGQKTLKAEGHTVENFDDTNAFDLSRGVRGKFLGDVEETDMGTWGVENGNIFELTTDSVLDPFDSMRLSMGNMVDVNVINDYKIKSIRDFTDQFGKWLEGSDADFLSNGLDFIHQPKYVKGIPAEIEKQAEGVRKAILSMWQHSTYADRAVASVKEKIVRSLRTKIGDKGAEWVGEKVLSRIQRADQYLRGFAFHTKFAFNPKQLFLQAQSAVNVMAISPRAGTKAAMLFTPIMTGVYAHPKAFGKVAETMSRIAGVSKEDYIELVTMFKRSGYNRVGKSTAYAEDFAPPKVVRGVGSAILDAAPVFYNTGERVARTMAFAAAYLERKAMKGTTALNRADEAAILKRADTMTGNMSRASKAAYQDGYPAVATQFFGYQMRMMEQMLGLSGNLTRGERARLFGTMSVLYGVPVASGMTFGVVPVREWIKDWLATEKVDYKGTAMEPFIDGFASQLIEAVTGTDFNVEERYAPGGLTTFYDIIKGDAELSEMLYGASGGIVLDTIKASDPILKWTIASLDMNDLTSFPLTFEDIIAPFKEISVVNQAHKIYMAENLGSWVSKNQNKLTDVSMLEAWIGGTLGIDPERVSDAFNQNSAMSTKYEIQKKAMNDYVKWYKLAVQALRAGDRDKAAIYIGRSKGAVASGGLTMRQEVEAQQRAMHDEPWDEVVLDNFRQYEPIKGK